MFTAARVANGIVALLSLFIGLMFISMRSGAMFNFAIQMILVAVFFLCDLIIRKRDTLSDTLFTGLWTGYFLYNLFVGLGRLSEDIPEEIGGRLFFAFFVLFFYLLPFILNGTHLARLLRKRDTAV